MPRFDCKCTDHKVVRKLCCVARMFAKFLGSGLKTMDNPAAKLLSMTVKVTKSSLFLLLSWLAMNM
eukprot:3393861-Amphidinium_carterae.1